ncbi:nuclear transport factor 2 family protein [Shimia sp. MMG029]|uniref:nuclear transport factor 2 family protein n=1 Tax=Shimia sp. MMG029 TaxID=3021978 RepID=UPI0022FF0578|nr:nuclear transport factor 2 family protein [Shimia sp. MMG029]MDA5556576.1 nuclear transport factor 2 family protein [Shimia sp. MMG029]
MTLLKKWLATAIFSIFAQSVGAQERSQIDLASQYYLALYAGDHETVRSLAAPDMTFEDPSAPAEFGLPAKIDDLNTFLDFLRSSLPAGVEVEITNSFSSNDLVVLNVATQGIVPASYFGMGEGSVSYTVAGVSVLSFENGLVVRHTDYFDYPGLTESLRPVD